MTQKSQESNEPTLNFDEKKSAPDQPKTTHAAVIPTVQAEVVQATAKPLKPWQNALVKSEGKFLAISNNKEKAKIELGFASQLIQNSEELQRCDPDSIINAVINIARTSITINPILKLAHLINRGGKCTLDFSYIGLVKMLKDYKCIRDIQAIIVYSDEKFEETNSQIVPHVHERIHAKTEEEHNKREVHGVYCRALLMDNTVVYTSLTPNWEILKSEKASPGSESKYSPWKKWREEMIKKTKIRKDFKTLISGQMPNEIVEVLNVDDESTGIQVNQPKSLADTFGD